MITVCIIGSGNVAQHLIASFQKSQSNGTAIELIQVYARQKHQLTKFIASAKITNKLSDLLEADLYIMAISDDAISEISSQIPFKNKLVVHTSGNVAIHDLDTNNRRGVFYPLQTFTKNKAINFKEIPICLESENATDFQMLEKVAKLISNKVVAINSNQRKALHVSAVFVNNFTNHLFHLAHTICEDNQVSFELLQPLLLETAQKALLLSPKEAQTGPAKRGDSKTIAAHIAFLSNQKQIEIYKLLTQSIQNHEQEL